MSGKIASPCKLYLTSLTSLPVSPSTKALIETT
jgi:hypothetical protein